MTHVHKTYCGYHFMMYISQIIVLYILNWYCALCQSYVSKIGRKKYFKNWGDDCIEGFHCDIFYFLLSPYYGIIALLPVLFYIEDTKSEFQ